VPVRGISPNVLLGTLVPVDSRKAATSGGDAARRLLAPTTRVLGLNLEHDVPTSGPLPRQYRSVATNLPEELQGKPGKTSRIRD